MGAEASRRLPPSRWPAEPGVQSSAPGVRCPGPCGRPQRRSPREPAAWARAREFRPPRPAGTPHMATRLFSRHFLRWAPPSGTLCRGLTDGRGGPEEPGAARLVVCGVGGRPVRGPNPGREGRGQAPWWLCVWAHIASSLHWRQARLCKDSAWPLRAFHAPLTGS